MDKPAPVLPATTLLSQGLMEQLAGSPLPGWDAFARTVRVRALDAGQALFEAGAPQASVYVVRSGLLKLVYATEAGDSWIKSFIAEGQFFASLAALKRGGAASFGAAAIEPAVVEEIDFGVLSAQAAQSLPWQRAVSQALLLYGARKEARERDFLVLSPAGRYRAWLRDAGPLLGRVRQQDLARYLGMTPESLSRLKARERGEPPG